MVVFSHGPPGVALGEGEALLARLEASAASGSSRVPPRRARRRSRRLGIRTHPRAFTATSAAATTSPARRQAHPNPDFMAARVLTQLAHGRAAAGPDVPLRERRLAAYLRPLGSLRCRRGRRIGGFPCRRGRRRPGRFLPTSVRRKRAFGRKAPHGLVGMDGIAYQQVEQAGAHYDGHARRPHGKADAALGQGVHHAAGRLQAERAAARKHHGMHRLYHVLGLEQVGLARGRAAPRTSTPQTAPSGATTTVQPVPAHASMRVADAEGGQVGQGGGREKHERFFRWKGRFVPPIVHRQRPQRQHASLRQRLALRLGTVCGAVLEPFADPSPVEPPSAEPPAEPFAAPSLEPSAEPSPAEPSVPAFPSPSPALALPPAALPSVDPVAWLAALRAELMLLALQVPPTLMV